jgi:DNA-binding GntR family transcriptional regulator
MLNRQSLSREIAETLEHWIVKRVVSPGDQLRELRIATQLGTSQSPVREAFRLLEERGLVTHTPNKGTTVADFNHDDVRQIIVVRTPLETLALNLAKERASSDDRKELLKRLKALDRSAATTDVASYHKAHAEFHRHIWRIGQNGHLLNALERLCVPLWTLYLQRIERARNQRLSGVHAHTPFADFVCGESRHSATAEDIVQQHLARIGYEDEDVT